MAQQPITNRDGYWIAYLEELGSEADRSGEIYIPVLASWFVKAVVDGGVSHGPIILCRDPNAAEHRFFGVVIRDPTPGEMTKLLQINLPSDGVMGFKWKSSADWADLHKTEEQPELEMNRQNGDVQQPWVGSQLKVAERNIQQPLHGGSGVVQSSMETPTPHSGPPVTNPMVYGQESLRRSNRPRSAFSLEMTTRLEPPMKKLRSNMGTPAASRDGQQLERMDMDSGPETDGNESVGASQDLMGSITTRSSASPDARGKDKRGAKLAVIVDPGNPEVVFVGGNPAYKMPLEKYEDALRRVKHPTATYMISVLLRRIMPAEEIARMCADENRLAKMPEGAKMLDPHLIAALKKQAMMQFPHSSVNDQDLVKLLNKVQSRELSGLKKRQPALANPKNQDGSVTQFDNDKQPMSEDDDDDE